MDLARGEVRACAHMTLPTRLRQIRRMDHRLRIRRGQDVVNAVATRAICYYTRSHSRCQAVIAVLVTTHAFAGDAKLLRESYAFMAVCASLSGNGTRHSCGCPFDRRDDVVNPVTISANRRARHTTQHRLPVNALHELRGLSLVTLAASRWYVDFGDR